MTLDDDERPVDRTDPNRHLRPHPKSQHCVDGVCLNVETLFQEER